MLVVSFRSQRAKEEQVTLLGFSSVVIEFEIIIVVQKPYKCRKLQI